jgi:hypothetical protein
MANFGLADFGPAKTIGYKLRPQMAGTANQKNRLDKSGVGGINQQICFGKNA